MTQKNPNIKKYPMTRVIGGGDFTGMRNEG